MRKLLPLFVIALIASPAEALSDTPDLTGKWTCNDSPILIRGEWSTLQYTIEIKEQRNELLKGTFTWVMPEEKGVQGEKTTGERAYEGAWTALGIVGWDGKTVEIVQYKGLQRHSGTLEDADTIRFIHSKIGNDAWVSRSTCKR